MVLQHNPFLRYHQTSSSDNPFQGPLAEAVRYDYINSQLPMEREGGLYTTILPIYEWSASHLVDALKDHTSIERRSRILDLGSGTGAATRMILPVQGFAHITGIEQSEGMLEVANYKFHKKETQEFERKIQELFNGNVPEQLSSYWQAVRTETEQDQNLVRFIQGDLRRITDLVDHDYDAAIANQSLHWLGDDLPAFFTSLRDVLSANGIAIWNSASDFIEDNIYHSAEFSFRYNDFMGMICEKLSQKGYAVGNYKDFRRPKWKTEEIEGYIKDSGFTMEQKRTILVRDDFQRYLSLDLPLMLSGLLHDKGISLEDTEKLARETAAEIINECSNFMADTQHKYDITPIFVMRKK